MNNFDNDVNNYKGQPNHELNSRNGKSDSYNSYHESRNDTEFASDFLSNDLVGGDSTSGALIAGSLGLAATVVALFVYSFILGAIGIALGCYAVIKGAKIIGISTICIGLLAMSIPLFYNNSFMSLF